MRIKYYTHQHIEYSREVDTETEEGKIFMTLLHLYGYRPEFSRWDISEKKPYECYDLHLTIISIEEILKCKASE